MKNRLYIYVILAFVSLFTACSGNKKTTDTPISQEQGEVSKEYELLNTYIKENYTLPYNIDVVYKLEEGEQTFGVYTYPPKVDKALVILKAIKSLWLELCEDTQAFPKAFLKGKAPIVMRMYGGATYNGAGLEMFYSPNRSAVEMQIYNVNSFDPNSQGDLYVLYRSVLHQFVRRLVELKSYNRDEFYLISKGRYTTSDKYLVLNNQNIKKQSERIIYRKSSMRDGFLSAYAQRSPQEDFCETVAMFLLHSQAEEKEAIKKYMTVKEEDFVNNPEEYEETKLKVKASLKVIADKERFIREYFRKNYFLNLDQIKLKCIIRLQNYKYEKD